MKILKYNCKIKFTCVYCVSMRALAVFASLVEHTKHFAATFPRTYTLSKPLQCLCIGRPPDDVGGVGDALFPLFSIILSKAFDIA